MEADRLRQEEDPPLSAAEKARLLAQQFMRPQSLMEMAGSYRFQPTAAPDQSAWRPPQTPTGQTADQRLREVLPSLGLSIAGMIPGVGDAIDANDVRAGLMEGDMVRAGFGAAGLMLPFVGGRAMKAAGELGSDAGKVGDTGALARTLRERYPEIRKLDLRDSHGSTVELADIDVDPAFRSRGVGSNAMRDITQWADQNDKTVWLQVAERNERSGTTGRQRLVDFYRRFGFLENKGRNKDYALSRYAQMFRRPTAP